MIGLNPAGSVSAQSPHERLGFDLVQVSRVAASMESFGASY